MLNKTEVVKIVENFTCFNGHVRRNNYLVVETWTCHIPQRWEKLTLSV